jgi:glyceraldehyde-3-phosphate dehydrogenase/erythrose-4-phosphate dehydrogenase
VNDRPCCCLAAGVALRVPTPTVSVVDLVVQVEKKTFAEEVNEVSGSTEAQPAS